MKKTYIQSVEDGYTREKEERTTENKTERRVPMRHEKYWTERGGYGERRSSVTPTTLTSGGKSQGKEELQEASEGYQIWDESLLPRCFVLTEYSADYMCSSAAFLAVPLSTSSFYPPG